MTDFDASASANAGTTYDAPAPPTGFAYSPMQPSRIVFRNVTEPVIVTYHTSGPDGGGYEDEASVLLDTLRAYGYGNRVAVLDGGARRSWREATMRKSEVVLWALRGFQRAVIWLDADARLRAPLDLFDSWPGGDIGIRLRPIDLAHPDRAVWCGGTVFWSASIPALALAKAWHYRCQRTVEADSEQEVLAALATEWANAGRLLIRNLPPELYWFDRDEERHPGVRPVIEHRHASRRRAADRYDGWRWYEVPTKGVVG